MKGYSKNSFFYFENLLTKPKYGKENGQVDVVTFGEMSDSDLQKMKKAMKKVFKKHKLPANDKKFHFCISSKFTN